MKLNALICLVICFALRLGGQTGWQGPRPAWVTPVEYDYSAEIKQGEITEGYYYFLADRQVDVKTKTYYNHHAVKIFNSDGVDSESKINFNYNPLYQKLKVHTVRIHRGGKVIDKLTDARYSELQREEDLENNLYRGRITVNLILTHVNVGDIIEYAYSITGDNPIFDNKLTYSFYLNGYYAAKVKFHKIRYDAATTLNIRYMNDSIAPLVKQAGTIRELTWDQKDVKGLKTEASMPASYEAYNLVGVSEYSSWAEVAKWGVRISQLEDKEIAEVTDFIKGLDSIKTLDAKIISCLRYTQDNIRYFGVEIGENSHRPKPVEKIIKEGYGDCKDKTSLFRYLLRKIGVTAYPVLVNSDIRSGIYSFVPSPAQFDHVITMVALGGKNYFFDPTMSYQRGDLNSTFFPDYGYGLILADSTRHLTRLHHSGVFDIHVKETFDLKNMAGACDLSVKSTYLGYDADEMRQWIGTSNTEEIRKSYKEFYEKKYGDLDSLYTLNIDDNTNKNSYAVTENYKIKNIWSEFSSGDKNKTEFNAHIIVDMINKINIELKTRIYPLSLDYPTLKTHEIEINLPEDWSVTANTEVIENDFIAFKYRSTFLNNKIRLKYSLEIKQASVPPDKYEAFKKDVQKIKNSLDYSITHNTALTKKLTASKYNWQAISFAILFAVICLLIFLYCLRFFKPRNYETPVPAGIGGWLILPLLGLAVTPLRILYLLLFDSFFENSYWVTYTDETSSSYQEGYAAFLFYQVCYNIALYFLNVFALIQFTRKNHKVPQLMVAYYLFYFLFQNINNYFTAHFSGDSVISSFALGLVKTCIPLAIWIPYFLVSKRVKETFVV